MGDYSLKEGLVLEEIEKKSGNLYDEDVAKAEISLFQDDKYDIDSNIKSKELEKDF